MCSACSNKSTKNKTSKNFLMMLKSKQTRSKKDIKMARKQTMENAKKSKKSSIHGKGPKVFRGKFKKH